MTDKERRYDLLTEALGIENDNELIATIVENVGNVGVKDVNETGGEYEIFMRPGGFTEEQLNGILELFQIREIGIYGDPAHPDDTVYFHMVVVVR